MGLDGAEFAEFRIKRIRVNHERLVAYVCRGRVAHPLVGAPSQARVLPNSSLRPVAPFFTRGREGDTVGIESSLQKGIIHTRAFFLECRVVYLYYVVLTVTVTVTVTDAVLFFLHLNECMQVVQADVPWYSARNMKGASLGSLIVLCVLRCLGHNLSRCVIRVVCMHCCCCYRPRRRRWWW